eukprot:247218-Chlamydomonas_euryale.AAC.1
MQQACEPAHVAAWACLLADAALLLVPGRGKGGSGRFCVCGGGDGFMCAEGAVVLCVRRGRWFCVCGGSGGFVCAEGAMVLCVRRGRWFCVCVGGGGCVCAEGAVLFVCRGSCGIVYAKVAVVLCVRRERWFCVCGGSGGQSDSDMLLARCAFSIINACMSSAVDIRR